MKIVAAVAALAALAVPLGLPAPADAATSITVDNPSGDEYESGAEVVVTGYNGSPYSETLVVECRNSARAPMAEADPGSFSVSVGSFTGPDSCQIRDYYSWDLLATFTVAAPTTTVSAPSVSSGAFYPLVRDRFRDTVTFRWTQSHLGRATIKVVNARGATVRMVTPLGSRGRNAWSWNGRNRGGDPVVKGRYRVKVTVNANTVSAPVSVTTGVVTRTFSARKEGNVASSFRTGGDCYARRDSYYQTAILDCWGGRFAQAAYRIAIPAAAFDVRGVVDLMSSDLDYCCRGRITKGWSRPSKTSVTFWARVTNWRATEVNFVRVVYKKRVQI